MASLKELRNRITSVKSTQRITSAMKMVSAAKLRRAQELAVAARPYAERMERMLSSLAAGTPGSGPKLLAGTGSDQTHLLVVVTSDRGLCGSFNQQVWREIRRRVRALQDQGKTVKLMIVGRKGATLARREFPSLVVDTLEEFVRPLPRFEHASEIAIRLERMFEAGEFDVCTIYYNKFISALTQEVTPLQLVPFALPDAPADEPEQDSPEAKAAYEFEPSEEDILDELLPRNLGVQIFRSLLETYASEQGARMTAMDNATRNAGDMIHKLSLNYNRTRQAMITKELIEIISGAEAV